MHLTFPSSVTTTSSRRTLLRAGLVASFALFGACGATSTHVDPIYQGLVSANGGTVQTTTVLLVLSPGWSSDSRSVAILPQPTPLPIDPAAGGVDYMPGLMCIGPVGFVLGVPAYVRFCYDPADIPAGSKEADLVLLEWDDAAGFMRVSQTATQDFVNHCFEDLVYGQLGHIGVGVRSGPVRNFVFQGNPPPLIIRELGVVPLPPGSLILADDTGALAPQGLFNTGDADLYIPSRDGQQLLFRWNVSTEDPELRAVDSTSAAILFDANSSLNLLTNDPFFGWFPDAKHLFFAHQQFADPDFFDVFADSTIDGATRENLRDGPLNLYLRDVRISPDGARALLRYQDVINGGERADVIATATGAMITPDLPVLPNGSSTPMPRWLPDSSGLYFVDALGAVSRINADGTGLATMYVAPGGPILDFALAPGASPASPETARCAYVRSTPIPAATVTPQALISFGSTFFSVDVLAGGSLLEQDLGVGFVVAELAYHPDGQSVWCELYSPLKGIIGEALVAPGFGSFVVSFNAADATTNRVINSAMGGLDISRTGGQVLLWMQSEFQDTQFPTAGLWRLNPDGTGGTLVPTPGFDAIGPPRFLTSWRTACCGAYSPYVR